MQFNLRKFADHTHQFSNSVCHQIFQFLFFLKIEFSQIFNFRTIILLFSGYISRIRNVNRISQNAGELLNQSKISDLKNVKFCRDFEPIIFRNLKCHEILLKKLNKSISKFEKCDSKSKSGLPHPKSRS